ncbi:probable glutamate receptor [Palaemon carinicauda]|uniref:probable glutamate receptor n=1 Tax=Palaemon carinicauda TaxID=392227 RepID=UPI0035B5ADD9
MTRRSKTAQTSINERSKMIWMWLNGIRVRNISVSMGTSQGTVYRWIRRWREKGTLDSKSHYKYSLSFQPYSPSPYQSRPANSHSYDFYSRQCDSQAHTNRENYFAQMKTLIGSTRDRMEWVKLLFLTVATSFISQAVYVPPKGSNDLLLETSQPAGAVIDAYGSDGYMLITISDGSLHATSISKITSRFRLCFGIINFVFHPNEDMTSLTADVRKLHETSKYPHLIVASDNEKFLASVLGPLFQADLLAWTTKLLVITRLPIPRLEGVKGVLSRANAMVLVPYQQRNIKMCNIYFFIPYSYRPLQSAKWTEDQGLSYVENHPMFPEKFNRLIDGGHLQVAAEVFPPHTLPIATDRSKENKDNLFRGPMLGFVDDILTTSMNFTYTLRRPPDGAFGYSFPNGSWSGMIGLLVRKEIDFAIGPFNLIYARARVVDYTMPLMIDYGRIMARKGEAEIDPWGFFMPLSPTVWLGLLGAAIVIMALAYVMSRLLTELHDKVHSQYSMTNYLRILLGQNSEVASVKHWANSIIIGTWMIAMLVVMESYAGNLRSLLIVRYVPQPYHTVKAVVDDPKVTVLWEQDSAYKQLLYASTFGVFKQLADEGLEGKITFITTPEFYGGVDDQVSQGDHVLMIEDMTLKILLAYHFEKSGSCLFYLSRERFFPFLLVMTLQKHSPLTRSFNRRIVGITESGIYGSWLTQEFRKSISCMSQPTKILLSSNLDMSNLWGIFVVYAIGNILGGLTLLLEIAITSYAT